MDEFNRLQYLPLLLALLAAPIGAVDVLYFHEYLLHILGSTCAGAVVASYFVLGPVGGAAPPRWLVLQGNVVAFGGVLLTLAEVVLFAKSRTPVDARAT